MTPIGVFKITVTIPTNSRPSGTSNRWMQTLLPMIPINGKTVTTPKNGAKCCPILMQKDKGKCFHGEVDHDLFSKWSIKNSIKPYCLQLKSLFVFGNAVKCSSCSPNCGNYVSRVAWLVVYLCQSTYPERADCSDIEKYNLHGVKCVISCSLVKGYVHLFRQNVTFIINRSLF